MSQLYTPVAPGNIRLLRVNADRAGHDVGSLEVVALDAAPPYYTLSHCWGSQARNVPVRIGAHTLHVTFDLASGIQKLRSLASMDSEVHPPVKYVWIDSICINQEDIQERSSQVRLMGTIYSQSIRTLVWLGPKSVSCSLAWRLIDHIFNVAVTQYPLETDLAKSPRRLYSSTEHAASGLPDWNSEAWLRLKQLLELQWFSRIWVVQEIVLSLRDPMIMLGEELYPWHRLGWAASWMRHNGYTRVGQVPVQLLNVDAIGVIQRSSTRCSLEALLSITQVKFHATDQRDKIYSLLGLAAECQDSSKFPDSLRPDYSMDVAQVYTRVARFLLDQNRSLAMLTCAHGTSGSISRQQRQYDLQALPSWVPDWSDFRVSYREIRKSLSWIDVSDDGTTTCLGFSQQHCASARSQLTLSHSMSARKLRVDGMRADRVARVIPCNHDRQSNETFNQRFPLLFTRILGAATSLLEHTDMVSWATRLVKVTTADQHRLGGRLRDQSVPDGVAYLHNHVLQNADLFSLLHSSSQDTQPMELLRRLSVGGEPEKYAALARNFCFNRCFFMTAAGRIGIGPSDTQVHDTVAVIPGGGVPYIVRQQRGAIWDFVGESYVDGLMDSEAMIAHAQGNIEKEVLEFQ